MRHDDVRVAKLIDYAHRLGVGSIYRRLGYLLDLFGIGTHAELQSLRTALTATYVPLDPLYRAKALTLQMAAATEHPCR